MPDHTPVNRDVRMRGFADRVSVETALDWVDRHTSPLGRELVELDGAHGRVLADDVIASINVPSFQRSAMDGYALRGSETVGAGSFHPLSFTVIGESTPGNGFDGRVDAGQAVRIMTGAPIPRGADAVLPAEFAQQSAGQVEALATVAPGKHVAQPGEDITAGTVIFRAGRRLRPQDVGLLASVGLHELPLTCKPRVRLLVTGDELVVPGQHLQQHQIYDANSSMLQGLIARDGGVLESHRRISDNRHTIRDALLQPGADVMLVTGGTSVGAEDFVPTIVAEHGELAVHGIAMRPSSPTGMGRVGEALIFLLPGNPVSCLCAYDFFTGRAIRRMSGRATDWPYQRRVVLVGRKIVSAVGRVDYARVRWRGEGIEPIALSGASILSSTTRADGFVIVPAASEGYAAGTKVEMFLYDPTT